MHASWPNRPRDTNMTKQGGPGQVFPSDGRTLCRVAEHLTEADATGVTFRYKDYRIKGPGRYKTITLKPDEFIRRFLMHVLPNGFPQDQALRSAGERHQGRDHRTGA